MAEVEAVEAAGAAESEFLDSMRELGVGPPPAAAQSPAGSASEPSSSPSGLLDPVQALRDQLLREAPVLEEVEDGSDAPVWRETVIAGPSTHLTPVSISEDHPMVSPSRRGARPEGHGSGALRGLIGALREYRWWLLSCSLMMLAGVLVVTLRRAPAQGGHPGGGRTHAHAHHARGVPRAHRARI